MRRRMSLGLLLLLLALRPCHAQSHADTGFWQGKYEYYQFNVGQDMGYLPYRSDLWKFDYDLYQNSDGVVRLELTHMNRNRSIEGPLDIELLDYGRGKGWIWDRGGNFMITGPLNSHVPGKSLGTRQIIGLICEGREYEWTSFKQSKVKLQTWTAQGTSFKFPVLRVSYHLTSTDVLSAIDIRVITELEPVSNLPLAKFEVPTGLRIDRVPSIE